MLSTVNSSCVVVCVLSCCGVLWNGGGCEGWSCRLSSLSSSSLSLCVGVRGSARAALRARTLSPNTIVFSLLIVCFCLFSFTPRLSSPSAFSVIVEWRWRIHHVSVCLVGMTAMGSLSRSSSFFW